MAKKSKAAAPKIEVRTITSQDEWLRWRREDVTASGAPALLGAHPYQTAFGLFLEKTGQEKPKEESGPLRRGRLMEGPALQILREDYPDYTFERANTYHRDPALRFGATPDIIAMHPKRGKGVVQVKSVAPQVFRAHWQREDGIIEPPLYAICQAICEHHLVDDAEWCAVAPIVVGFGVECPLIEIPLDKNAPRLLANMKDAIADFWKSVKDGKAPEFDYEKDGERIAALYGISNGQTIDLSRDNRIGELLTEDDKQKEIEKAATEKRKAIKAEVLAKMGAAEVAYHPEWDLTFKTQERRAYEVKATSFRVMRAKRKAV